MGVAPHIAPLRMSLGRAMLLEALQHVTQREIARRCKVSQPTIARLAAGAPTDSYRLRRALERYAGIPIGAWDEPFEASARDYSDENQGRP